MKLRHKGQRRWLRAALAAGAVAATAVALVASPASAAPDASPKRVGNPNAAVSDEGSVSVASAATSLRGVSGYRGTGVRRGNGATPGAGNASGQSGPHGEVGTETVIAPDGRWQVTNTTTFPARATVLITRNGSQWCTGWLIGANTVATAGHCLHSGGSSGSWYTGAFVVWPGRNGGSAPYGSCGVTSRHSVVGWTQNRNEQYDYGAMKLNCTVGNTVGWYGMWWQSASLTGYSSTVSGYPCDKAFGTHWRHTDSIRVTQDRQLFYQNDTYNCQSGSPVYQYRGSGSAYCAGYCSMAIHAYGLHGSYPHSSNNHGTRITQSVFNNLIAWRNL